MAQCIKPIKIVNPRYIKLAGSKAQAYRDFGLRSDLHLIVPCGRCLHCLRRRGSEWRRRLLDEYRYMPPSDRRKVRFITLTVAPKYYSDFVKRPKYYIRLFSIVIVNVSDILLVIGLLTSMVMIRLVAVVFIFMLCFLIARFFVLNLNLFGNMALSVRLVFVLLLLFLI